MLTDARYNAALDAVTPTSGASNVKLSVHDAYSATGASIISGTAKTAGTLSAATGRSRSLASAVNIASVPAAGVVRWIGIWDATTDTTFLGMVPNGGSDKSFQIDTTANERIYCEGHGLANGDKVVFHNDTAPGGLTAGTEYFVVGVTAGDPDYFQVSATSGGAAINLTSEAGAQCRVSKLVPETYASGGTHQVATLTISL